jgi:hypothetical protein
MRTKLFVLVHLVAFAALAILASPAAAWPGPHHRVLPTTTTPAAMPAPAADLLAKTTALLGASTYPWVQPVWTSVHGVVLVKAPTAIQSAQTEPTQIGLG